MPTTSNLEVQPAPPSWKKCVGRTHFKETITEPSKRGFLAVSTSFFRCVVRVHSIASHYKIVDFSVCFLQQEVFALGVGNGGLKSPVAGSLCFPSHFLGLHKNRQVNTFQTLCFGIELCVIFDFGAGARPLHANFRPLSAVFKNILVTVLKHELLSAIFFVFLEFGVSIIAFGSGLCYLDSTFDKTRGFPGEGPSRPRKRSKKKKQWSRMEPNFTIAEWNPRSLTFQRFQYAKELGYDVLVLPELWRNASKFTDGTLTWTHSKAQLDKDGNRKFPLDRAAGVGILLSDRARAKCLAHGSPCERITWVRLKGPVTNLFIIGCYMPHRARSNPSQQNTMDSLIKLLSQVPPSDCIVLATDLNEQLPSNVPKVTGKWAHGEASQNADKMIDLLRMFDMFAVNTAFQPKRNASNATFMRTLEKAEDDDNSLDATESHLVGRKVSTKYQGTWVEGTVKGLDSVDALKKWVVVFEDGYSMRCSEEWILKNRKLPCKRKRTQKQIDFIFVSNRWRSSVIDAKVRWGPSIHRNLYGKDDHALVVCTWSWRLRAVTAGEGVDWSALQKCPTDYEPAVAVAAPTVPTPDTAKDVESALESLNFSGELFGTRASDTAKDDVASALATLNFTGELFGTRLPTEMSASTNENSSPDTTKPLEGGKEKGETGPSALCSSCSDPTDDVRRGGASPKSDHSNFADQTSARVDEFNTPNLGHVNVRGGRSKNSDPLLTHAPNAPELNSLIMTVPVTLGVKSKPLKVDDGVVVEGRYAQYHQCPESSEGVRGRDECLADNQVTAKSRALMSEKQDMKWDMNHFVGNFVLTQIDNQWKEGRVLAPLPKRSLQPPRWLIMFTDKSTTTGDANEVQRWSNCWSKPNLYFCTPVSTAVTSSEMGRTSVPARGYTSSPSKFDPKFEPNHVTDTCANLIACPRCNHSFCGRHEWISRFAPTLECGRTITPDGHRYCCECGDFYGKHSPVQTRVSEDPVGSPTGIAPLGRPPPPPPPPPEEEEEGSLAESDEDLILPDLVQCSDSEVSDSDSVAEQVPDAESSNERNVVTKSKDAAKDSPSSPSASIMDHEDDDDAVTAPEEGGVPDLQPMAEENTASEALTTEDALQVRGAFQLSWSEEMRKAPKRSHQLTSPASDSDVEEVVDEWFSSLCNAVKAAAKKSLPSKKKVTQVRRRVSAHTKDLFKRKKQLQASSSANLKPQLKAIQQEIKASCLQDFKSWVDEAVTEMEKADNLGNTRRIFNLVNMLSNKPKQPPANLNTDANGDLLRSPEDIADAWEQFLSKKFNATPEEQQRPQMPPLEKVYDPITRTEFEMAVKKLKLGKAPGPDGVPATVYKHCPQIRDELFRLTQYMWDNEVVPTSLVTAKFKMLFKNKGSSNNPSKYRCIALLNHAYKVLSYVILGRLLETSDDDFLPDWHAGFREGRGCRDNSMVLRVLSEKMLSMGKAIAAVFIDYTAAFDSVSHKFVDLALEKAGVSTKARAMFRAVYKAAAAFTDVASVYGKKVRSNRFNINRGVLQGDVTSPLFFILALELILRRHDKVSPDKGIPLAETMVHALGYADDVVVLEPGTDEGIQRLEDRVNAISHGSKEDADMSLSTDKTKTLHITAQQAVSKTTKTEARDICKFVCPHLNCGFKFLTKAGLRVHEGRCEWKDEFEVDKILNHRGPVVARQYQIRWKGYSQDYDTWEPRSNVHPDLIREYELVNNVYVFDWRFRCDVCDLPCSSARGIKLHRAKSHKQAKEQNFRGSLADNAVIKCKLVKQQEDRPVIHCDGAPIENVFQFKYLGTVFSADAQQGYDIKSRIAQAFARCGKLRHVFDAPGLSTELKIRLYKAAICSILTYGCETWRLTPPVLRQLNGANSKMLARFTHKSIPQEARPMTCSFNLVRSIRVRRFLWLGHILRAGQDRITYQAIVEQKRMGLPGNILMDAPPHNSLHDLAILAKDRANWKALAEGIQ